MIDPTVTLMAILTHADTALSISGALSRPNLLQYSPYMAQCCKELAQAQEHASDVSLTHIISLNRLGEEIQAAFHEDDEDSVLRVEQTRVQMLLRSLERQLKDWKVEAFQDNKQVGKFLTNSHNNCLLGSCH